MILWNQVTWYSRYGAFIFFLLVLPVLTFYIGMKYQETTTVVVQGSSFSDALVTSSNSLHLVGGDITLKIPAHVTSEKVSRFNKIYTDLRGVSVPVTLNFVEAYHLKLNDNIGFTITVLDKSTSFHYASKYGFFQYDHVRDVWSIDTKCSNWSTARNPIGGSLMSTPAWREIMINTNKYIVFAEETMDHSISGQENQILSDLHQGIEFHNNVIEEFPLCKEI